MNKARPTFRDWALAAIGLMFVGMGLLVRYVEQPAARAELATLPQRDQM